MAKLNSLAPDSAGFKVLMRLHQCGGAAPIHILAEALWTGFRSASRFHQIAGVPLLNLGLVTIRKNGNVYITPEGQLLIENYKSRLPAQRQAAPMTGAMNTAKFLTWGQGRPGALDYRSIPSVMGDERVPYAPAADGVEPQ